MTDDRGPQQPEGQAPPPYPPTPPPTGEHPDLGYVPGQPYPPQGQSYPPPGQPGWAQQPAQQPGAMYPVYVRPDLPKATASMVIGIIAVAGGFVVCGLPLLISPVAWVLGAQARRQIREAPQQWGGESKATAGLVLGIIGTILLVLALIVLVVIIVVAINDPTAFESDTGV
jgi:hypothetical protein